MLRVAVHLNRAVQCLDRVIARAVKPSTIKRLKRIRGRMADEITLMETMVEKE